MDYSFLRFIPTALVGLRFAIAPLLLWDALDGQTGVLFTIGFCTAFLSDIFDGIIARRLGVSTARLRQADGWADMFLYACVATSVWLVHREVAIAFALPVLAVVAVQLILFSFSWLKFRQFPSYHTYTAKAWGIGLFIAAIALFSFNQSSFLWLAIIPGLINSTEEIIMTLILSQWHCDVLSLKQAWKLRNRD